MFGRPLIAVCSSALVTVTGCKNDVGELGHVPPTLTQSPTNVASPILALGETANFGSYRVRFVSQQPCAATEPGIPRNGNQLWAAELEVVNLSARPLAVNPFYLTLKDEQNHTYVTSLLGCPRLLDAKILSPGERVRGYVPFELPQSLERATLLYRPVLADNLDCTARFAVEF